MPDLYVAPKEEVEETPQSSGSLASFSLYPENIRFDTQTDEEKIILLLRRHWITNLSWLLTAFILFLAPPLILPPLSLWKIIPALPVNFVIIAGLFWYLAVFGFTFVSFIGWYFNVYIVTSERIIDVDFYQLLYKKLSSTRITKIQDVTYKLGGVLRSLFDFGDVFIQTAGTETNFEFAAIPHPEAVVRKISELMDEEEQEHT